MRWVLVFLVSGACTDEVTYGQVQAIEDGSGRIELRACLDAELFSCGREDVVLTASHDGNAGELKYTGLVFPEHHGSVELGPRDEKVIVADGDARVQMKLPPAFELSSSAVAPLHAGDEIHLQWAGAGEPMVWDVDATCDTRPTYPSGPFMTTDDDGELSVTVARLEELLGRSLVGCEVGIELSRVWEGDVGDGFHAESATGIARRTATVTIE